MIKVIHVDDFKNHIDAKNDWSQLVSSSWWPVEGLIHGGATPPQIC